MPEAANFWHPKITKLEPPVIGVFEIDNNDVPTRFDRGSYQGLFSDLQEDIRAESRYVKGSFLIAHEDLESVRLGCTFLDIAKDDNPLLDLSLPLAATIAKAKPGVRQTVLQAARDAACQGKSLSAAVFPIVRSAQME
jgi:hypothetical protein